MDTHFKKVIEQILKDFGLGILKDHSRFISVLQDYTGSFYEKEKRFLLFNSDQVYLDLCGDASQCSNEEETATVISRASHHIQNRYMSSADWADGITDLIVRSIYDLVEKPELYVSIPLHKYTFEVGDEADLVIKKMKPVKLIWNNSNEEIATLDENGHFIALKPGITQITAKMNGNTILNETIEIVSESSPQIEVSSEIVDIIQNEAKIYITCELNEDQWIWAYVEEPDLLDIEWTDEWNGDSCYVILKKKQEGETNVTFYVADSKNKTKDTDIEEKTIKVICRTDIGSIESESVIEKDLE